MSVYEGVPCIHEFSACRKGREYPKYLSFNSRWSIVALDRNTIPEASPLPNIDEDDEEEALMKELNNIKNSELKALKSKKPPEKEQKNLKNESGRFDHRSQDSNEEREDISKKNRRLKKN